MIPLKKALTSSTGKKYVMGVTGLSLVGFMVTHLAANLALYWPDPSLFNLYPHKLAQFGALLTVAELGLAGLFAVHAAMAIWLYFDKRSAGGHYASERISKGGNSRFNLASLGMTVSGLFLLVFLVLHVLHFRFGPAIAEGYVTMIDGQPARDLYRLVAEEFKNPVVAGLYVVSMLFLGLHLRHGFWSAFQSLGAMKPEWSNKIYAAAAGIAFLFTIGFLFIPIWFYFDMPGRLN
jgi:succinate dehydrogenase / fumarate reductase, cytochrome b subunit